MGNVAKLPSHWGFPRQRNGHLKSEEKVNNLMSDVIALNHMPLVNNPLTIAKELELTDMWEIIGSAFVKHQRVMSLLLELATPLQRQDLPLLTR